MHPIIERLLAGPALVRRSRFALTAPNEGQAGTADLAQSENLRIMFPSGKDPHVTPSLQSASACVAWALTTFSTKTDDSRGGAHSPLRFNKTNRLWASPNNLYQNTLKE
jgi:hypothetical protein